MLDTILNVAEAVLTPYRGYYADKEVEMMSIGENIRDMRQRKEWTQRELAEKIGINQSMIAQIERGTKTVTLPLGKQIAEVFGCTVDDLFNEVRSISNVS